MFPYNTTDLHPFLEELEAWKDLLDQRGPLPRTWAGRLRRDLEAEAVAASTSMEGVPVTVEEVHRILAGDRPTTTTPDDAELVRGYRDAMGFALRRADDPGFRWERGLLVALHDLILAGRFGEGAGRLRTAMAYVGNSATGELIFTPPEPGVVPALTDEAMDVMHAGHPHPAVGAAWVHLAIAAIHPFRDGNGRTARISAALAMLRGGFRLPEFTSLEEWWGRHLGDYYASSESLGAAFDPDIDVTAFIRNHLQAQLHQIRALDLRERTQRQIWLVIEEAVKDAGLDGRVANAVWEGFFGRGVTSRYYRELVDVGEVTAATDLKGTVAAGLLSAVGAGRGRHYVTGHDLYRLIGQRLGVEIDGGGEPAKCQLIAILIARAQDSAGRSPQLRSGTDR
ncbi:MAG: Fic family protein [Actinobacteria bacterium]|nr:Fic family protein [Actinomycetota bacterium]